MSYESLTLLLVVLYFIIFLGLGQNIPTVLFATGILGLILTAGPSIVIPFLEADIFYRVSTYSFITIPLYVIMAFFLFRGDVIKDVYYVVHQITGKRRSPLGAATVIMGGMLGAVSGSGTAISAGLAVLAGPELQRYGYTKSFSVSLAAIGGSLSAIVPPSIIIIIYASIAELSIGKMFMAAVFPGILLTIIFAIILLVFERFWPNGVVSDKTPSQRLTAEEMKKLEEMSMSVSNPRDSIMSFIVIIALVVIVFGGIYSGIMTATEAGGIAAMVALVAMMARGKISFKTAKDSFVDGARFGAMIMAIVIGAQFFGRYMSLSLIPRKLIGLLDPLMGSPLLIVLMILIFVLFLGMILESAAIMVMLIPITDPIIRAIHVDPIWFGILCSFCLVLGMLTPPVGLAAYAASTAAKCPMGGVFRYTTIFAFLAAAILLPVLFAFPKIVTWLPSVLGL